MLKYFEIAESSIIPVGNIRYHLYKILAGYSCQLIETVYKSLCKLHARYPSEATNLIQELNIYRTSPAMLEIIIEIILKESLSKPIKPNWRKYGF